MEWFKCSHEIWSEPKFAAIARETGEPMASVLAVWIALMCRATENNSEFVTNFQCVVSDIVYGFNLGVSEKIKEKFIEYKILSELETEEGTELFITNWHKRQGTEAKMKKKEANRIYYEENKIQINSDAEKNFKKNSEILKNNSDLNQILKNNSDARLDKIRLDENREDEIREDENRQEEELNIETVSNDTVLSPALETSTSEKTDYCPHNEIIKLYHQILPELPQIRVWGETNKKALRSRWREDKKRQNLEWWRVFFEYIRTCPFLMGQTTMRDGRAFTCTLGWIIKPTNFEKILNNNYTPKYGGNTTAQFIQHLKDIGYDGTCAEINQSLQGGQQGDVIDVPLLDGE